MSKKPLHLQQKRYEVRPCRVPSKRAKSGYAVNYWYIHDTERDVNQDLPLLGKWRAFKTRKQAVAFLNKSLERGERPNNALEKSVGEPANLPRLHALFRL